MGKNLVGLMLLLVLFSCKINKSVNPADRYAKEHKDKTYSYVLNNNESFKVKSLKQDVKDLEDQIKALKKLKGGTSKVEEFEAKLVELREIIKELK